MKARPLLARTAAGLVGGILLLGVAGTAVAAEVEKDSDQVAVDVSIAPLAGPGSLSMSVARTSMGLTESGSTSVIRQFVGTLPTVTVVDTRDPATIPAGAGWYVLGTSSEFTGTDGQPTVGAENFGWAPRLLGGDDTGTVAEGDVVDTAIDGGPDGVGLVDRELLMITNDSAAAAEQGTWSANADLFLRTDPSVDAGDYSARITLSLFE